MAKGRLVNANNVKPFVCDETYSSKLLIGDEVAGCEVINVNEGTLGAHQKTAGGTHEKNRDLLHCKRKR